mmetsp:Transcript_77481/g.224824  ORF Transcript_77481/g.224824 Transcript_77481/m.224824 type:complete len:246 (+) Transcript_77481:189-926(+)
MARKARPASEKRSTRRRTLSETSRSTWGTSAKATSASCFRTCSRRRHSRASVAWPRKASTASATMAAAELCCFERPKSTPNALPTASASSAAACACSMPASTSAGGTSSTSSMVAGGATSSCLAHNASQRFSFASLKAFVAVAAKFLRPRSASRRMPPASTRNRAASCRNSSTLRNLSTACRFARSSSPRASASCCELANKECAAAWTVSRRSICLACANSVACSIAASTTLRTSAPGGARNVKM